MKNLPVLVLLITVFYLGCTEIVTTPSSVTVEVANPNTQQAAVVPGLPPVILPNGVTLVAVPSDVEGRPGDSVWITITAFKDGLEVASFDVDDARVVNPIIASVSTIDGRQVQFRLNSLGTTSAIVEALGAFVPLSVWVR